MDWDDAVEGYWLAKSRNLSKHTISDYKLTFRRFGGWIGTKDLSKVRATDVRKFLDHLDADLGLAPKTVANHWIALSSMWSWLNDELGMEQVMAKVERPRFRRQQPDPFSRDDVRKLVSACYTFRAWDQSNQQYVDAGRPTAARDAAIIVLFVATGLRVSELCALTAGDYDRKRGKVTIRHGKGDKMRIIFAGDTARKYLWRYLINRGKGLDDGAPLFLSNAGGAMQRRSVQSMLTRTGERAGVANVHPHRFRHTFAVNFLRNGGSALELRELLGHEKMETVLLYVKLAEVDLELAQRRANVADNWRL